MKVLPVLLCAALLAGCRRRNEEKRPAPSPDGTRSAVQTVVEGVTGKTAVRSAKKARGEIEAASAQRNRDIEDAMQ